MSLCYTVHCTYLGETGNNFNKKILYFCLKIFLTFTNRVDPDEMQRNAAFYLGLHCLRKNSFRGFPYTKTTHKLPMYCI